MTPKEALRILKDLVNENTVIGDCERECLEVIEKELNQKEKQEKLLNLLKNKKVDLHLIDDILNNGLPRYDVKTYNFCCLEHLTKDEFDSIKRWMRGKSKWIA